MQNRKLIMRLLCIEVMHHNRHPHCSLESCRMIAPLTFLFCFFFNNALVIWATQQFITLAQAAFPSLVPWRQGDSSFIIVSGTGRRTVDTKMRAISNWNSEKEPELGVSPRSHKMQHAPDILLALIWWLPMMPNNFLIGTTHLFCLTKKLIMEN